MNFGRARELFKSSPLSEISLRVSRFFSGVGGHYLQRKPPTNTQHQDAIESAVGFIGHGLRVVANEGENFASRLRTNSGAIVLPSLHSLICYTQHLSHLDIGQTPVNACQPEMFSKCSRMRWNCFLNPPIHRNHWKTCDNRPTTNTQQRARPVLPPPPFHPPCTGRASHARR